MVKTDFGAGLLSESIAGLYSPPHSVGDYCVYRGRLYRCIYAVPSEAEWNVNDWQMITLTDAATNSITAVSNDNDEYDSTKIYSEGDLCIHNYFLYKRNSWEGAAPVAEEWDSTHWTQTSLISFFNALAFPIEMFIFPGSDIENANGHEFGSSS